jgi:general secretion pathway protein F|tara:strand:- start:54 stop:1277 length:1224 start_codon:yes stop_codon:yes gene_type:complete
MAAFEFQALDNKGKQHKGVLEADSSRQIRQQLRDKGWMPLSVEATSNGKQKKGGFLAQFSLGPSLKTADLALITRQLATLIAAGLPIDEALKAVSEQSEKQVVKSMVLSIRSKVLEGHTLADALKEFPRAFPHLYRATVSAGEHAGHLDGVLNKLADYTESQQTAQTKIKLAAMYPIILCIVAIGIVVGLLTYVVPDIVEVFVRNGQELPGLTQLMLDISHLITNYGLVIVIVSGLSWAGFLYALRKPAFKYRYHQFLLTAPGIKNFTKSANTARYISTLAILTSSGVPLVEAMRIASQVVENLPIQAGVKEATVQVSEGGSLSKALTATKFFSPMMLHMIASGESSGELDDMLARTSAQQQASLEATIEALVKMFEPLMLLTMGAIVATIVTAIMLPILELQNMVQ